MEEVLECPVQNVRSAGFTSETLQITVFYDRWSTPQYRGGYADVWKGECLGRPVTAKVIRVYSTSDFDKTRKVRHLYDNPTSNWQTYRDSRRDFAEK